MNKTKGKLILPITAVVAVLLLISAGCSSGTGGNSPGNGAGSYSLTVAWPGTESESSSRLIPSGSSRIEVSISGDGLESARTASITLPDSVLTVTNVPAGNKVATVKAFDSSSNLKAQRKVSFAIIADQTTTSDSVPLGMAITGNTTNPIFEPSTMDLTFDSNLHIQNWLAEDMTPQIKIDGTPQNPTISGACQDNDSHQWIFSDAVFTAKYQTDLSIPGKSSASGAISAPIVNYAPDKMWGKNGGNDITNGSGNGEFYWPSGIDFDSTGNIYVADTQNGRIQKFNSNGGFLATTPNNYLPYGFAVDRVNNLIYLCNGTCKNMNKFNLSLGLLGTWSSLWTGDYRHVNAVATSPSGTLYVATGFYTECQIQKLSSSGALLGSFGGTGTGDSQFQYPFGIAVDTSENVYVADYANHRIQKFTSTGTFISKWGKNGGDGSWGRENGEFAYPFGLAIDRHGYIYVSDRSNHRMQKLDLNGKFITKWGISGTAQGEFNQPCGVAVDSNDVVYITDSNNNRIQTFKPMP